MRRIESWQRVAPRVRIEKRSVPGKRQSAASPRYLWTSSCGAESSLTIWPPEVGYPSKFFKPR